MATLSGITVLVTGASGGLGRATALALAGAGARVLVHARTEQRAAAAARELAGVPVWGDLGSVAGVRELADQVAAVADDGLHVLVNNAGGASARRDLSPEGVERTIAVHHVASAALTALLLPVLRHGAKAGRPARVVNVSSTVERFGRRLSDWSYPGRFSQWQAYCDAKLLSLAFTYALAARLDPRELTVNAANPGNVATGFGRNGGIFRVVQGPARILLATPEKGARTAVRLASDPALDTETGGYYVNGRPATSSATSRDPAYGQQVMAQTVALLDRAGLGPDPFPEPV